jgi:hypothetical protein
MHALKKVNGIWRGVYGYEPSELMPRHEPVPFTLTLKQGWFGHFTGSVTDDPIRGMPGTGAVDGYFSFPRIEFTKRMPVAYFTALDGRPISLREFLAEQGHALERDAPHQPIFYQGEFSNATHAQGTWIIRAGQLSLGDGRAVKFPETKGNWSIDAGAY